MKETDIKWGDIYFDKTRGSYLKLVSSQAGTLLVDIENDNIAIPIKSTPLLLQLLESLTHVGTITSFTVSKTTSRNINLKQ